MFLQSSYFCLLFLNTFSGADKTWRLVPLESLTSQQQNTNYHVLDSQSSRAQQQMKTMYALPEKDLHMKPPSLYESEMAMNRIERFLASRDHVDKTEFDFLVRSVVEHGRSSNTQDGPYPISRNQIPFQSFHQQPTQRPIFSHGTTSLNGENISIPSGSAFAGGRRRLLEPSVNSTHLPTVSAAEQSVLKANQLIQRYQAKMRAKKYNLPKLRENNLASGTSMNSERNERGMSSPVFFKHILN